MEIEQVRVSECPDLVINSDLESQKLVDESFGLESLASKIRFQCSTQDTCIQVLEEQVREIEAGHQLKSRTSNKLEAWKPNLDIDEKMILVQARGLKSGPTATLLYGINRDVIFLVGVAEYSFILLPKLFKA